MRYAGRLATRSKMALGACSFGLVCLTGCATRAILVPPGEPVRLRATVRRAKVWVADKNGQEIPAVTDLPAGWFALPDPGD